MANICVSIFAVLLVTLYISSDSVRASPVDGEVLFDSNVPSEFEFEMPDSCSGKSYCFDKGANYPEDKIEELLKDLPTMAVGKSETRIDFGSRNGDTYEEPDCPSNSTEKPIYYITDENDQVRVVVQSPKFQQIYSVKWCVYEGLITRDTPHFLKKTAEKFSIQCISTKMNVDFFVLNDDLKMEAARAKGGIPVCCRCRYDAED